MSEEEPSLVGTVLGSYRITEELSRGGMGAVYRARHEVLERPVAVKLLRPELTGNRELVVRFMNEAKAASAIRHPGIIEVLDFGHADDGRAYLVMEFLDGESLAHRIAKRGRLGGEEAAQIARSIASALGAAHARGIVHRDLKPDNVFLVPDAAEPSGERAKVLDFGIAKLGDLAEGQTRYTQTGALMGTPLYMAPEQARGAGGIDHRADQYSLGCIMYEMLVGEPPFVAVGAGEIIALHLFQKPRPLGERVPGLAPALERLVMRLLEKEPADRMQSVAEVSSALAQAFTRMRPPTPLPVPVEPSITAVPTPVPTTRRRSPAVLVETVHPTSRPLWPWALVASLAAAAAIVFAVLRGGGTNEAAPSGPAPAVSPPLAQPVTPVAEPPMPTPMPTPTPTTPATPVVQQAAVPQPPVENKPVKPVKRSKRRDQTDSGSAAKYTKDGSPIEIDLN